MWGHHPERCNNHKLHWQCSVLPAGGSRQTNQPKSSHPEGLKRDWAANQRFLFVCLFACKTLSCEISSVLNYPIMKLWNPDSISPQGSDLQNDTRIESHRLCCTARADTEDTHIRGNLGATHARCKCQSSDEVNFEAHLQSMEPFLSLAEKNVWW